MVDVDAIRMLIEAIRSRMNELSILQKKMLECVETEQFIPDVLKESLINAMDTLENLEHELKLKIKSVNCDVDVNGLSDAQEVLDEIIKAEDYNKLVQQLKCVVMDDEEDEKSLFVLIDTISGAINNCDYENKAIAVGKAFINDLKNNKVVEMKTIKEFKNEYAFLRISVYERTAAFVEDKIPDVISKSADIDASIPGDENEAKTDYAANEKTFTTEKEDGKADAADENDTMTADEETHGIVQPEPAISISTADKMPNKKLSVTECLNVMTLGKHSNVRKPNPMFASIIYHIDQFGVFSVEFMNFLFDESINESGANFSSYADKLVKLNILGFVIADEAKLYYLSQNGKKLFENKTFRQLFFNKGVQRTHVGEKFEVSKWDIAATIAFEQMCMDFIEPYPNSKVEMYNQNIPGLRMFDFGSSSGMEFFITSVMRIDAVTLAEYKRALFAENDREYADIRLFTLASTDFKSCISIFSEIKEHFFDIYPNAKVIFYAFNDHKYYDPVSGGEVVSEAVISELNNGVSESNETVSADTLQNDPDNSHYENEDIEDEDIEDEDIEDEDIEDEDIEDEDIEDENIEDENIEDEDIEDEDIEDEEDQLLEETAVEEMRCSDESSGVDDSVKSIITVETQSSDYNYGADEENDPAQENYSFENKAVKVNMRYVSYDEAVSKAEEMIISGAEYSALAYLKIVSSGNSEIVPLYELAAFSLDDPMMNKHYSSNTILSLIDKVDLEDIFVQSLLLSAAMRTVFYNDSKFDYDMRSLQNILPRTTIPEIRTFIQRCIDFKERHKSGFDLYCDYRNKAQISARKEIEDICKKAYEFYNAAIDSPFREKTKIKRYRDTVQQIFSHDSLLAECLMIVAQNNKDEVGFAKDYISEYIKGDAIDTCNIREEAIDQLIDDTWEDCCEDKVLYHSTPLVSGLRAKLKNRIRDSLVYIVNWVHNNDICDAIGRTADESEKSFMLNCISAIKNVCEQEIAESRSQAIAAGHSCVRFTCDNLISRINGSYDGTAYKRFFYINMLMTGDVMLRKNENGAYVPDLNDYCYGVNGYTIEDRILRNYEQFAITNGFEKEKPDFDDAGYCDLQSAGMLVEYYEFRDGETSEMLISLDHKLQSSKEYEKQLNRQRIEFIEELELKKSYGVFDANNDDDIKELLLRQSDEVYNYSALSHNYGFYKRALDFIRIQIEEDSKIQRDRISKSLNELLTDEIIIEKEADDPLLKDSLDKSRLYIESGNYTAAEDLINRIISGDLSSVELNAPNPDLADFQRCYRELYDACFLSSGVELKSSAKTKKLIERYSRAMKDARSANRLASLWISNATNEVRMQELLSMLGMDCEVSSDFEKHNYNHGKNYFDCTLKGNINTSVRFSHVIAPFGSLAHTTSFRTLCLFGKNDDDRLFNEIDKLTSFKKSTIIFVDYTFNEQFRRELSDRIKRGKYGEVYMVIDRVMFLYLVTHYQKESIIGKFINVSMPYSYYQPYVYDSMSRMPPEMFFGRTDELQKIEDRNGIHLLYGGRQLGKSALLKRAKLSVNGISGQRAVYIDVKNKTVCEVAEMVCEEMITLGLFDDGKIYSDWKSLCKAIKESIIHNKITYFLLLLDEGDNFIADCANYNYSPIEEMKRIMETVDFKFVIAGLHNLVRYDHESAVSDNSVIPHLKTLTIKPFKNIEARKLLEVPLAQVGLFFNNDALISTILATTNYFPGLIQLYCSKLITSLQDIDKTIYPIGSVPPYYINEKHIQKVLANEEFTEQIKEKFEITLELDNDNYYQIIALLMAEMYHNDDVMNHSVGYSADEVYTRGCDYEIKKISDLDLDVFTAYMDELVELNIFRKHPDNSYTFLRQNFFQLMGNSDEIYDRLQKYIDE